MKIDCSRQLVTGQTEIVTHRAPVGAKKVRKFKYPYSFSLKIERKEELTPMVFGLYINQSLLRQNNITDMNIYFYDPINAVRFIPSKVKKLKHDCNHILMIYLSV